jgi:hypothetical protein
MDNKVKEIVRKTVEGYTGKGLNDFAYLTASADGNILTVLDVVTIQGQQSVHTSIIIRLIADKIIIDHDNNNKPLVDALIQAGIPRKQIILAYEGESIPAAV